MTAGNSIAPEIKIAAQMSPEPAEQYLEFVRQMGVEYVVVGVGKWFLDSIKKPFTYPYASFRAQLKNSYNRRLGFNWQVITFQNCCLFS